MLEQYTVLGIFPCIHLFITYLLIYYIDLFLLSLRVYLAFNVTEAFAQQAVMTLLAECGICVPADA